MAKDKRNVTLGLGTLYVNNIDVGHLSGDVNLALQKETVDFTAADDLAPVTMFKVGEGATLSASIAELKLANLKLALGIDTAIASGSYPANDPSSFVPPVGASYDTLAFGGSIEVPEYSIRFEHTRKNGKKVIVVFFIAVSNKEFTLGFKKKEIVMTDITFQAMVDDTRPKGANLGFIVEQTA